MTTELDLAQMLFEAQKDDVSNVDAALFSGLDRDAAYRIQARVMDMLGEQPALIKTAISPDGVGTAAPIYRSRVGQTGALKLPGATLTGLEVEVGLVLKRDLDVATANSDPAAITDAIDHYFVGIEVCGTRYVDRTIASHFAGVADNMSAFGYVINPQHREYGADIENWDVKLEFNDATLFNGPAKHSFGTVLASFVAYAKAQNPAYPLKAGDIVTPGSMCGLVPVKGPGHAKATFGVHVVEFDIV